MISKINNTMDRSGGFHPIRIGFLQYHPRALDAWVERYADRALEQFPLPKSIAAITATDAAAQLPALLAALSDDNCRVRSHAADALGRVGPAASPALIATLKDRYSGVRYSAASALGKIGPAASAAVPALLVAGKDNDSLVRTAAAAALEKICNPVIWKGKQQILGPEELQSLFASPSAALLIEGPVGSGKTTQASRLAHWALATNPSERLCRGHRMLPILFPADPLPADTSGADTVLNAIRGRLQHLIGTGDTLSTTLVYHLLRTQRVLVVVDDLSERDPRTRSLFLSTPPELPLNALIVTSRHNEHLQHRNTATLCTCLPE